MNNDDNWDEDIDAIMKSQTKHDWMSEPRFRKIFDEIEDGLQGVMAVSYTHLRAHETR